MTLALMAYHIPAAVLQSPTYQPRTHDLEREEAEGKNKSFKILGAQKWDSGGGVLNTGALQREK